jgi:hypothetical protein
MYTGGADPFAAWIARKTLCSNACVELASKGTGKMGESYTVVEVQSSDFGAAVVKEARCGEETGHRGDGDNVAFLHLEHARKKLSDENKM